MPKILLTDVSIRTLKPSDKRAIYYDKNLSGFGVRVGTSGTKTYTLTYGTGRNRITLGKVGVITLLAKKLNVFLLNTH